MSSTNFLVKKPLLSFFLLTYIISWAIWIPLLIYYYLNPFPLSFTSTPILILIFAFLGFFGPTFAALIMAALQEGPTGIKKLLSRWKIWRVGIQWYLFIPLFFIVVSFTAIQLYIGFFAISPQVNWGLWYMNFPAFLQAAIIGGAIAEETGWRGYALPRLMRSQKALNSSLILGVIWALWHLPLNLIPGANIPVPLDLSSFLAFLLNAIALSVIMTWLFNNTKGSVFITYLFHAGANSISLFSIVYRFENFSIAWLNYTWFNVIVKWIFILIIIVFFGSTYLSRKFKDKSDFMATLGILETSKKELL